MTYAILLGKDTGRSDRPLSQLPMIDGYLHEGPGSLSTETATMWNGSRKRDAPRHGNKLALTCSGGEWYTLFKIDRIVHFNQEKDRA